MRGPNRFNFPQWNYGYTLGPPTQANGGNYTQFYMQPQQPHFGGILVGGGQHPSGPPQRPSMRGGKSRGGATANKKGPAQPTPATSQVKAEPDETKDDKVEAAATAKIEDIPGPSTTSASTTTASTEVSKEEGEIVERPLNEILRGRNPIMYCNDQSKMRNLHMEWEQVSETGPPHDKTFTWSLKMGPDMQVMGSSNSKKGAKNKAAEEMVKKLDQLPKANIKRPFHQAFGAPPFMMRGGGRGGRGGGGGGGRGGGFFGSMPPPQFYGNPYANFKKAKKETSEKKAEEPLDDPNKPLHPAQNNPISKLYEFTKKRKLPEPVFEVVQEEVLETRKTAQGFTYKKTKFTLQCEIMGKKFTGESMNKKTAKFNAAAAAWADVGAGVGQASIDSLLQSGRQAAEAASSSTSS